MRYRAFADEVKAAGIKIGDRVTVHFYIPMPKSWSKKKKYQMSLHVHQQKPDLDNLVKALLDAVFNDDSHVHSIIAYKFWSDREGYMVIS